MKRRLTSAYDRMIMPDRCSRKIEAMLLEGREQQKTGRYARVISPVPVRRQGWAVGAALVCLLVVLLVSGSVLYLAGSKEISAQQVTVASGDYALVTDIPVEDVENFAASIRENVLAEDWAAFAEKVSYPISVSGQTIGSDGGLVDLISRRNVSSSFVEEIRRENCRQMFCNGTGICMGDGEIWFNEVDGQLKIMAINDMFTPSLDYEDLRYARAEDGNVAISSYGGMVEGIAFPDGYGPDIITQIGIGEPVFRNGETVKNIQIPDTVAVIGERAFANCPVLESVSFKGDAPAEAEGVFEGSENVTVYYRKGTKGWGDTWCGRKTEERAVTHIPLGTVELKDRKQMTRQFFRAVLEGTETFWSVAYDDRFTIEEYCKARGKVENTQVTIPYFALVDIDRDGLKELALWVNIEGDPLEDYLILRCSNGAEDTNFLYTFMEPQQKITDLKKDGSFYERGTINGRGDTRVVLDENNTKFYVEDLSRTERTPVLWHTLPCARPDVILESYEYAGTGQNAFPGSAWYVFEGIITGTMENNWARWEEQLSRWGAICLEEEGQVRVYDPDAPGRRMVGTLDEAGRFDHIAFYISNEFGELEAEICKLSSGAPSFWINTHQDTMKRQVYTTAKLLDYLEGKEINDTEDDAVLREQERIRILMNEFMGSFMTGDRKLRDVCLVEGVSDSDINIPFGTNVEIISYDNVPTEDIGVGETCSIGLLLREVDNPAETHRLDVQLVKQEWGWKILSCHASE